MIENGTQYRNHQMNNVIKHQIYPETVSQSPGLKSPLSNDMKNEQISKTKNISRPSVSLHITRFFIYNQLHFWG